jgi:hypothetical protein
VSLAAIMSRRARKWSVELARCQSGHREFN